MDGTVLIADDDQAIRTILTQAFTRAGARVRAAATTATLWKWVREGEGDLVVTDVMMPDGSGLDLVPQIRRKRPELPIIVISARNTLSTAVEAREAGAHEYLPKPFDLRLLLKKSGALMRAAQQARLGGGQEALPQIPQMQAAAAPTARTGGAEEGRATAAASPLAQLTGRSSAMQEIYRLMARLRQTTLNIVVSGEPGTGRSRFARVMHELSQHGAEGASGGCVSVSADRAKEGALEALLSDGGALALCGGTLIIERADEMAPALQGELLSLLEQARADGLPVRVIAITRSGLEGALERGSLREDLYYRLNVIPVQMPPLRARIEDLELLAVQFMQDDAPEGMAPPQLSPEVLAKLRAHTWPGNLSELRSVLARLQLCAEAGEIAGAQAEELVDAHARSSRQGSGTALRGQALPLGAAVEMHLRHYMDQFDGELPPTGLYNRVLEEVELPLLTLALAATYGNQIKAAELLGLNRNTLRKKIQRLGIQLSRSRQMR